MEVYDILEVWSQSQSINPGMPCFLCIGSMGKYLTSQNSDEVTVTGKNETSAFFAIVWPETKTFSYYAAGDGNIKVEEKFQEQSLLGGEPFKGALVAKATHHGALKAFHEGFFKHLSPAYYVVSAGKEYGHPSKCLQARSRALAQRTLKYHSCRTSAKIGDIDSIQRATNEALHLSISLLSLR